MQDLLIDISSPCPSTLGCFQIIYRKEIPKLRRNPTYCTSTCLLKALCSYAGSVQTGRASFDAGFTRGFQQHPAGLGCVTCSTTTSKPMLQMMFPWVRLQNSSHIKPEENCLYFLKTYKHA